MVPMQSHDGISKVQPFKLPLVSHVPSTSAESWQFMVPFSDKGPVFHLDDKKGCLQIRYRVKVMK